MKILELYSGIGGMHYAAIESGLVGKFVAIDNNTVANGVYRHNFPTSKVLLRNISSLTVKEIDNMQLDMMLLSPPCQPFTRVGLKKDILDNRTCSFLHIVNILPDLKPNLKYILIENVKGFEESEARSKLITALEEAHFIWQEFILSPSQFSIPNVRHRYYLIAKRKPLAFSFETTSLMEKLPCSTSDLCPTKELPDPVDSNGICKTLSELLETNICEEYSKTLLLPDKVLSKRAWILDIVTPQSRKSCCFTKAYRHYAEGTGSVLCPGTPQAIEDVFKRCKMTDSEREKLELLKSLHLRYFTPREVARLMSFPDETFIFPDCVTNKQKYRLLGNSLNVHVVSRLLGLLTEGDPENLCT